MIEILPFDSEMQKSQIELERIIQTMQLMFGHNDALEGPTTKTTPTPKPKSCHQSIPRETNYRKSSLKNSQVLKGDCDKYVDELFQTLFKTKEEYDAPLYILGHIFTLFAYIANMRVNLTNKSYMTAAIIDMLAERVWYRIKDFLNAERKRLGKGPNDCLVFHCTQPGVLFHLYSNIDCPPKEDVEENSSSPETPRFCELHSAFALSLQHHEKNNIGRLFALLFPEKGSYQPSPILSNLNYPDHYRSSLGPFIKYWYEPVLKNLSLSLSYTSFIHAADGAIFQFKDIFTRDMECEDFDLVPAIRLRCPLQPVSSDNVDSVNLALQQGPKSVLVSLIDQCRLTIMKDHAWFFLQEAETEPLSLSSIIARHLEPSFSLTSTFTSVIMMHSGVQKLFRRRCDDLARLPNLESIE